MPFLYLKNMRIGLFHHVYTVDFIAAPVEDYAIRLRIFKLFGLAGQLFGALLSSFISRRMLRLFEAGLHSGRSGFYGDAACVTSMSSSCQGGRSRPVDNMGRRIMLSGRRDGDSPLGTSLCRRIPELFPAESCARSN
jgi:hypothetical protein